MVRRSNFVRTCGTAMMAAAIWVGAAASATAQTTVTLEAPEVESEDAAIRGGSFADANFEGQILATRAASNLEYARRVLLKFNTDRFVPDGARVQSATLTLTVKGGNKASRRLGAYRVTRAFDEATATWLERGRGSEWTTAGGDLGGKYAEASVSGQPGSRVRFDVTRLVQETVDGTHSSRDTQVAVVDLGSSTHHSYREYYPSESNDASVRPVLTVVYGGSAPPATPPRVDTTPKPKPQPEPEPDTTPDTGTRSTLRLLHWNVHHGGIGTDGKYSPDRIATWIAKMRPDIISLNEVDTAAQVAAITGALEAKTGQNWRTVFSGRGNLLLTHLPVVATSICTYNARYPRRAAHLSTIVNGRSINVWSAHLAVDSARDRREEGAALQACARNWNEAAIIAGDYNMQAGTAEYQVMTAGYDDAWHKARGARATTNYPGNCDGCTRNSRIDYVFTSKKAANVTVKSAQIVDTRDARGKMPSDHKPMLVIYSVR